MAFFKQGGIASCPIEDMPLCESYLPGKCLTFGFWRWQFSIVVARKRPSRRDSRGGL